MVMLQGGGQNLPPHVCVIQKTPCGIGLNMFFKPQPGLGSQCLICAGMLLGIACQAKENKALCKKKTEKNKNYVNKVIVWLLLYYVL